MARCVIKPGLQRSWQLLYASWTLCARTTTSRWLLLASFDS